MDITELIQLKEQLRHEELELNFLTNLVHVARTTKLKDPQLDNFCMLMHGVLSANTLPINPRLYNMLLTTINNLNDGLNNYFTITFFINMVDDNIEITTNYVNETTKLLLAGQQELVMECLNTDYPEVIADLVLRGIL